MAQTLTCLHGHRWAAPDADPDAATLFCPVCGASASPPPTRAGAGDHTPDPDATVTAPPAPRPPPGLPVVPGYEILGELGRGGMSVVYKARHLKLNRVVALKTLTAGAHAGPDLLRRFRREAESFARLTHPNIVQIHEVGEIASHGPYLALEYVEGGSLSQKLARAPQPPRQAAEVVAALARAIHFAHERGVLHRDLKPANVMLTADGTPKVTDFGLARFLEAEAATAPDRPTPTGAVLGTPGYMAPEQASGVTRAPTAAVDVYALGAVLYEMLTGRPPFLAAGPLETMLLVMTDDPVPPRRLQARVPRDLETICLHCLRKNPRQRYPSAAALADDLQRFLDGRPIRARPAGPVERLVKWARRRPAVAALLAVSALAVLAGLGLAGWYQVQLYEKNVALTREKDQNDALIVQAVDAMSDYGDWTDETVAALPESDPARRALLEKRLEFFAPFEKLAPDNPQLQQRKARGLFEAARIRQKLGEADAAEKELNEAIRLDEAASAAAPAAREARHDLARACIQLGTLLSTAGRRDEAGRQYDRAVGLLQAMIGEGRTEPLVRLNLAEAYHNLALLRIHERRRPEALDAFGKAVDLAKGLAAEDEKDGRYKALLAVNYADRCGLYRLEGEAERGREDADAALALFDEIAPDLLAQERYQDALAGVHYHRGLLLSAGEPSRAFADYETAWKTWDRLRRAHPDVALYRFHAAEARSLMGRLCIPAKMDEAEADLREADALYAGLEAGPKDGPDYQAARDGSRYHLGVVLHQGGKDDEAERLFRDLVGRPSAEAVTFFQLGEVLRTEGEESLRRADLLACIPTVGLTVTPNPLGAYQGYFGHLESAQAEAWAAVGRFDEALDRLAEAGKRGQGRLPPDLLKEIATGRFTADRDLERALFVNQNLQALIAAPFDPARLARIRDECRRAADVRAELAEVWPSLEATGGAALSFRQAATDACYCLLIDRGDKDLPADQKAARQQADAERTVQLLQKAVAAGYHDAAELRRSLEAAAILNDSDPSLQGPREEFRRLLSGLEGKTSP